MILSKFEMQIKLLLSSFVLKARRMAFLYLNFAAFELKLAQFKCMEYLNSLNMTKMMQCQNQNMLQSSLNFPQRLK